MSDQVKISSIDALEVFRADLVQYIAKARVALEDMEGDVRRTQTWLDTDRVQHWGGQIKLWTKKLHQAEQELYSANLTNPQASNAFQKMNVLKARRKLEEAEGKMLVLKNGGRPLKTAPPRSCASSTRCSISSAKPSQGVYSLGESIKALQDYAEKNTPKQAAPPATTGGEP